MSVLLSITPSKPIFERNAMHHLSCALVKFYEEINKIKLINKCKLKIFVILASMTSELKLSERQSDRNKRTHICIRIEIMYFCEGNLQKNA